MLGGVNNTTGSVIFQGSMQKWKNELKTWEILPKESNTLPTTAVDLWCRIFNKISDERRAQVFQ